MEHKRNLDLENILCIILKENEMAGQVKKSRSVFLHQRRMQRHYIPQWTPWKECMPKVFRAWSIGKTSRYTCENRTDR
jgi:hypothetical protein